MQLRVATLISYGIVVATVMSAAGCGGGTLESSQKTGATPLIVYAARNEQLIKPVLDAYTAETGVPVRLTTESGRALVNKLVAERHNATADLLLTDGIGHLWIAAEKDMLRPTNSELLKGSIPNFLQDPESYWFVLLVYARTIAYDMRAIDPSELTGYTGLGDERWRGKLCLSSAALLDNQSLIAMLIAEHGEQSAELMVRAWVANLAMPVFDDDAQLLQAIEDARCDLGIANSDDAARLQGDHRDTPVAVFWPPASSGGAYINIVGAGVTRHASNPTTAKGLLEWLLSDKGQKLLAGGNLEYPVNRYVPVDASLDEWIALQVNPMHIAQAGYFQEDAVKLMERAGYARSD